MHTAPRAPLARLQQAGKQYGRNVAALVARLAGEVLESPAVLARRAREAAERRL